MYDFRKSRSLCYLLLIASISNGCSTLDVCRHRSNSDVLVEYWFSDGGPVPTYIFLDISESGAIALTQGKNRKLCAELNSSDLRIVRDVVSRESTKTSALAAQQRGQGLHDFEEIGLRTLTWEVVIPTAKLDPTLSPLLCLIADLSNRYFSVTQPDVICESSSESYLRGI